MNISAHTTLYGLLGHPVGHSLSPMLHNHLFNALGINGVYMAFDVSPQNLESALLGLKACGMGGLSVTIPHKETIIPMMDELSVSAKVAGAVNVVVHQEGRLIGHNTDGAGLMKAFEGSGNPVQGKRIAVIGAGGAARGIVTALIESHVATIDLYNRNLDRADDLIKTIQTAFEGVGIYSDCVLKGHLLECFEEEHRKNPYEIIIQTTSVGMFPNVNECPIQTECIVGTEVVCDIVYNPHKTKLLEAAAVKGCTLIHGIDMLYYQGIMAEELWLERQIDGVTFKNWFVEEACNFSNNSVR